MTPEAGSAPASAHVGGGLFAMPATRATWRSDGSAVLRSTIPLGAHAGSMAPLFRAAADASPERVLAAQREGGGGRTITYGLARGKADGLAQALLEHADAEGTSVARPVLILSGNLIEHLLLTLARYPVGSPVVPVSTAYSLLAADYVKLRAMVDLADPGLIFADDGDAYAGALAAVGPGRSVSTRSGPAGRRQLASFDELAATRPTGRVEERFAAVGPGTVAKILFTSGSTGHPKGVVNTHRMLCANQQMIRQVWPFLADEPPVLLDWLPWSHTFGGNHNVNQVIANAGSLPFLTADAELARRFFARLRIAFFAGAALPQQLWDAICRLAAAAGSAAPMTTSWGRRRPHRPRPPLISRPAAPTASGCRCPACWSSWRRSREDWKSG